MSISITERGFGFSADDTIPLLAFMVYRSYTETISRRDSAELQGYITVTSSAVRNILVWRHDAYRPFSKSTLKLQSGAVIGGQFSLKPFTRDTPTARPLGRGMRCHWCIETDLYSASVTAGVYAYHIGLIYEKSYLALTNLLKETAYGIICMAIYKVYTGIVSMRSDDRTDIQQSY